MAVLCKACGERPARVHYTEIVNNSMVSVDLCVECAEERGIDVQKPESYGLGDLVAGLIDTTADTEGERIGLVRCPSCGYDYSDFKKVGRFGCPGCYESFATQLKPLLRQLHGGTQHAGKRPQGTEVRAQLRRELKGLKTDLARAVEQENYEAAAKLRDQIQDLETKVDESE